MNKDTKAPTCRQLCRSQAKTPSYHGGLYSNRIWPAVGTYDTWDCFLTPISRYTIFQRIILHSQHTLNDIFRWQLGLNLAPWGPLRTYGAPKRVFWGPNRPCLPVFDRFLELGGSKLAITVLDEQGIPLRCSGHPKSLYLKQKMSITKFGRGNLGTGAK